MPLVPPARGAQIREAYEAGGFSRKGFATRTQVLEKSLTNITSGGICSRPVAARIAQTLNEIQSVDTWTPELLFTEPASAKAMST